MTPPENKYDAVLLFDGVCGLCNGTVNFILQHDPHGHIRFAALQSDSGKRLLLDCGLPPDALDSVVFIENGQCFTESSAVLAAMESLPLPWRLLAVFRIVPKPLRDAVYRYVARHRYQWFGRRETCRLPSAAERHRFLE